MATYTASFTALGAGGDQEWYTIAGSLTSLNVTQVYSGTRAAMLASYSGLKMVSDFPAMAAGEATNTSRYMNFFKTATSPAEIVTSVEFPTGTAMISFTAGTAWTELCLNNQLPLFKVSATTLTEIPLAAHKVAGTGGGGF